MMLSIEYGSFLIACSATEAPFCTVPLFLVNSLFKAPLGLIALCPLASVGLTNADTANALCSCLVFLSETIEESKAPSSCPLGFKYR